ncbi:hypothetical protein TNCT_97541, partial [Trichonephila clavata]
MQYLSDCVLSWISNCGRYGVRSKE